MGNIMDARRRILLNTLHIETASGGVANFKTDMIAPLKGCKVNFLPKQSGSGDPSPTNIRPISGWDGITVHKNGKNYIPLGITDFYRVYPSNGMYVSSSTAYSSIIFPIPRGTVYIKQQRIAYYNISYASLCDEIPAINVVSYNQVTMSNRYAYTMDNSDGHKYLCLTIGRSSESDLYEYLSTGYIYVSNNADDTYEDPKELVTFPISWTRQGTVYGGYVDLVSGEIVREWNKISIDETTPMRMYTEDFRSVGKSCNASYWLSTFNSPIAAEYTPYSTDGYCNVLPYYSNNYAHTNRVAASNSICEIGLEGTRTKDEFLSWLAENGPVSMAFRLAEPLHYPITPQIIKTLKGINNIWSDVNDIVEVKFWKH